MIEKIKNSAAETIEILNKISNDCELLAKVKLVADSCNEALKNGSKIIFAGNGGSFSDAQHLAAELVSKLKYDREPLAALALSTNGSVISALANDYGYETIFSRELIAISRPGDVFIPITTSGNSSNIINAINEAKKLKLVTFCMTGGGKGKVTEICECIEIPSLNTARIQEVHILIGHVICELIESFFIQRKSEL